MTSRKTHADLHHVGRRPLVDVLAPAEIERVHEATLDVLAHTGVMFHSQKALDVLEEHGAAVDRETTVAKLPPDLVGRALATVPRRFTLGARDPAFDLPVDGEHAYLFADGCATRVREADGTIRASVKRDVAEAARIVQGLDGLSATSALVSAQDTPDETRVLHEFDACVRRPASTASS